MSQDDVNPPEQLQLQELEDVNPTNPIEEELSCLNEILDLGEDSELFSETIRTSEVSSCSGCGITGSGSGSSGEGGGGDVVSFYEDASFSSPFSPFSSMDPSTLAALLDAPDLLEPPASSTTIYHPPAPSLATTAPSAGLGGCLPSSSIHRNDHFQPIGVADTVPDGSYVMACSADPLALPQLPAGTSQLPHIPPPPLLFEKDDGLLPTLQGMDSTALDLTTSCSFVDPTGAGMGIYFPGSMGMPGAPSLLGNNASLGAGGSVRMPADYQSDYGGLSFFASESTTGQQIAYNSTDVQVHPDGQHGTGACGSPTRLPSEVSSPEESTFKVGRLTVEERKEKIHRYIKKRNERNFSKKIKYACRKTLADSRPRVRGRFAKNDEFGEAARPTSCNHEYEDDEDVLIKDDDLLDSADIFAHLNSFKCNYTLESWI